MIGAALKKLFEASPSDLFQGDAHGVLCRKGLTEVALTYLSVPPVEWYADKCDSVIGLTVPRFREHGPPGWMPKGAVRWYFRADLPTEVFTTKWAGRVEQVEDGVWCVWFSGFSGR